METLRSAPLVPSRPLPISVHRIPFLLEPTYSPDVPSVCTNRARLLEKWGGAAGWERQKRAHGLKQRAASAGIERPFDLDRLAASTMASHRLVQYAAKRFGWEASERLYVPRRASEQSGLRGWDPPTAGPHMRPLAPVLVCSLGAALTNPAPPTPQVRRAERVPLPRRQVA